MPTTNYRLRKSAVNFFVWFFWTILTAFLLLAGVFTLLAGGDQVLAIVYTVLFYVVGQVVVQILSLVLTGVDAG